MKAGTLNARKNIGAEQGRDKEEKNLQNACLREDPLPTGEGIVINKTENIEKGKDDEGAEGYEQNILELSDIHELHLLCQRSRNR